MRNIVKKALTILLLTYATIGYSQENFPPAKEYPNKSDRKGNRKGQWMIAYKHYDWNRSITKCFIDFNNLEELDIAKLTSTDEIGFIENVEYVNGLKEGVGYFYEYHTKNKSTTPLAMANYINGKLDGEVKLFKNLEEDDYFAENSRLAIKYGLTKDVKYKLHAVITYKNGSLIDQMIEETTMLDIHLLICMNQYEKIYGGKSVERNYILGSQVKVVGFFDSL